MSSHGPGNHGPGNHGPGQADGRPLFFLIAGEPSGDRLGARLMTALRQATGGRARFTGVGGPRMAAAGLQSLFPYDRLSVMGLVEVVRHLPRLLGDIHRAARAARAARPAAVITIDSPDFSFRVARRLQGAGIPLVHYVAPSVWAWRPGRARKVAKLYDLLLCLLPFEPPWFTPHGLDARFVGHSVVEPDENQVTGEAVPRAPWPAASVTRLCLLPGSRTGEVRRLLPVFRQAVDLLARRRTLDVVVPTVPTVAALVRQGTADWSVPVRVVEDIAAHGPAMAQCDVALAASGTVTLELAKHGVPMIVAYRTHPLTAFIARRLLRVSTVTLINLVEGRQVIPEYIQADCTPERLAAAVGGLLDDSRAAAAQTSASHHALVSLGMHDDAPSRRGALAILDCLGTPPTG